MEESVVRSIEELFYKKIMLHSNLLDCFKSERESLINIDLDALWRISKSKEEICSEIASLRQEIISTVDPGIDHGAFRFSQIMDLLPRERRDHFRGLYLRLVKLKGEIELMRKENKTFIDDSIQFLDEIISIITGDGKNKITYNDKCHLHRSGTNILLSREA